MIVYGYIKIHLRGCRGWIIVMGFMVLLITYYISNARNISGDIIKCSCKRCKNKKKNIDLSKCCNDASSTKNIHVKIYVLVCT
jgi:hypothetical protein